MKVHDFIRVPYAQSVHGDEEIKAVLNVLRTSTQMGAHVREFEQQIAALFAKNYGVMVNSGSSANYLAVEILGLEPGCEVITPALTFSTTVAPLVRHGLIPSFVDVAVGTYNIDTDKIEEMITPRTKAVMVPSLIGNMPDWDVLRALADRYGLTVIEDSCDTLGAALRGRSTGARSDISTTSFYGSHIINCAGNGGMLCVNDPELAAKARLLRSWGRRSALFAESEDLEERFGVTIDGIAYDAKFVFDVIGYNLEPSEVGAAFGLVQLEKLEDNIAGRSRIFAEHWDFFKEYEEWVILPQQQKESQTAWLAFPLTIKDNARFTRREVQGYLEGRNIQTRPVFAGNILRQPGFANIACRRSAGGYPRADEVMRGGLLLACHQGLNREQIGHIHEAFSDFVNQVARK